MKQTQRGQLSLSALLRLAIACASLALLPHRAFAGVVEGRASKDIEIKSTLPNCSSPLGSATTLRVGYDADTISATHRSLLHFDLAAAGAPSSAKLINARLVFYAEAQTGANFDLSVHRVTEPAWSETSTWTMANCETPLSWGNAGGDLESTPSATFTSKGAGFYSVSITALAQDAIDNRSRQLHLLLKGADSLAWDNWLDIRSSEYATAAYQPSVLLTWGNAGDQTAEMEDAKDLELQALWWGCPAPMQSATTMRLGFDEAKLPNTYRNLLHFDLSAAGVPSSATLTEARLVFFAQLQIGANFDVEVYRLTQTGWDNTASWEEAVCSPAVMWATPGGDYTTEGGSGFTTEGIGFHAVGLAGLAQDAITSRSGQLHILMKIEYAADRWIDLRSREYTDANFHPVLALSWVTPTPTSTPTLTPTPVPSPTSTSTSTTTLTPTSTPSSTPTPTGGPQELGPSPDITAPPPPNDPNSIDPIRQGIARGMVRDADGPLDGVAVQILDHPEYGTVYTRANGMFDMIVNGGGELTVTFTKAGYIPVHRKAEVPWQDYLFVKDVVMIEYDGQATLIDTSSSAPFQVHRANSIDGDEPGEDRQATVLYPQGTTAQKVLADGTLVPTTSFRIRASEFTFGADGPDQMPAPLPPTSGYTYAVELSAHDPTTNEAFEGIQFSQPVVFYVENFLDFPTGSGVPVGYYDRKRAVWVPSSNGEIVEIVSLDPNNAAVLDTDADPNNPPDNGAALGITYAERLAIGSLYDPGQTLWRVSVTHFSPWDCNWPWWCKNSSCPPPPTPRPSPKPTPTEPCEMTGSVIHCQSQALSELIGIPGTTYSLVYKSDWAPGRVAERSFTVKAIHGSVPPDLKRAELRYLIAGRTFRETFPAEPNQVGEFTWDGRDAFGQVPLDTQYLEVQLGYFYDAVYYGPDRAQAAFAALPEGVFATEHPSRSEIELWTRVRVPVAPVGGRPLRERYQSIGSWSLTIEKFFDPKRQLLISGDGREMRPRSLGPIIARDAGTDRATAPTGDGQPALTAKFGTIKDLTFTPDGGYYIAESAPYSRIRYVDKNGILSTAVGGGGSIANGISPLSTLVSSPAAVEVDALGRLYFTHNIVTGNKLVRRLQTENCSSTPPCVWTIAGGGNPPGGSIGDGLPATQARAGDPQDLAFGPDGALYIADVSNDRVRKVRTDGIIVTVAGGADPPPTPTSTDPNGIGDGGLATHALLHDPQAIAFGGDGSLFIAERGGDRIRMVRPDGIITTVAGTGSSIYSGDGVAIANTLHDPFHMVWTRDAGLYVVETNNSLLRNINFGVMRRAAGLVSTGAVPLPIPEPTNDDAPALAAGLRNPQALALSPDGGLYLSDDSVQPSGKPRIRRVGAYVPPSRPGEFDEMETLVVSEDGTEVYVFEQASGRHLRTLDALTGAIKSKLHYDVSGRLVSVEDMDGSGQGNVTTIERNVTGCVTAIVAPGGQRTVHTIDPINCDILAITNPANETVSFTYYSGGLMKTMTDARDNTWEFSYDEFGRLIRDEDPAGGFTTLNHTQNEDGYQVDTETAMGRTRSFSVESVSADPNAPTLALGGQREINTHASGLATVSESDGAGFTTVTSPDGTRIEVQELPDPRFGMLAPITTSRKITTPENLVSTVTTVRTVTLSDALDPLSLTSQLDTVTVNGRPFKTEYTAANPPQPATIRTVSPLLRETLSTLDEQGRVEQTDVPGLAPISWEYDAEGRLARIQHGAGNPNDPNDPTRQTLFEYYPDETPDTPQDRLLWKTIDALGRVTSFEYDAAGRVTKQTLPDLREIDYTYDANGNLESLTPPGRPAHEFNYTPVNLESEYIPPQPSPTIPEPRTRFVYNEGRQLEEIVRPDGQTVDFSYGGSDGRLQSVNIGADVRNYTYYDANESNPGQLKTLTGPDADLSFTYDGSLLENETWTIGVTSHTVARTYDTNLRLSSLKVGAQPSIGLSYDNDGILRFAGDLELIRDSANGQLTSTAIGRIEDSYEYNEFGEVTGYEARLVPDPNDTNDPNSEVLFAVDYDRDKLGRIRQKIETIEGVANVYDYTYDDAGQLWIVREGLDEFSLQESARYTYDDNGNRTTTVTPDVTCEYTYDSQDRMLTSACGAQTTTYTYTADGALASKDENGDTSTYDYDAFGNLRSVTLHDGTASERLIQYLIDGRNRRIGKKVDGILVQRFIYQDQLEPVAELDGAGNLVTQFVYGSKRNVPDYLIRYGEDGGVYRIVSDHLGSARRVLHVEHGDVLQRMDVDEFGLPVVSTNPSFQPFGFAGGIYDDDTRMVRFGTRDYDPVVGRFLSKDPIAFAGADSNLYRYALGDPVNYIDPTGLSVGDCLIDKFLEGFLTDWRAGNEIFFGSATRIARTLIGIGTASTTARTFGTTSLVQAVQLYMSGSTATLGTAGLVGSVVANSILNAAAVAVALELGITTEAVINGLVEAFVSCMCEGET